MWHDVGMERPGSALSEMVSRFVSIGALVVFGPYVNCCGVRHSMSIGLRCAHRDPSRKGAPMADETAIRPLKIDFPEQQLDDRRRRISATRWPESETVSDDSQ